jgi:hypothetical protein
MNSVFIFMIVLAGLFILFYIYVSISDYKNGIPMSGLADTDNPTGGRRKKKGKNNDNMAMICTIGLIVVSIVVLNIFLPI